jgi:hypothetical protein
LPPHRLLCLFYRRNKCALAGAAVTFYHGFA